MKLLKNLKKIKRSAKMKINLMQMSKACEFCDIVIKECERAISEMTFDRYDKKRWKRIVNEFLGKKSEYYNYASEMLGRIEDGYVTEEDYSFMMETLHPLFEKEKTIVLMKEF